MRFNDDRDIAKYINSVEKFWLASGTRGDTTVATEAVDAADVVVKVAAITNFAASDPIFITNALGDFELNALDSGTPAGTELDLAFPAALPFAIGSRVVEAQSVDLGALDESGIALTGSAQIQDVLAATSRLPIASWINNGQLGGSFNLRNMNGLNLQTVFGVPESSQGAGTLVSPHRTAISGRMIGTEGLLCFRGRGVMADGLTNFMLDFCGVTPAPNVNSQFGGTNPAVLGVQFRCKTIILTKWT
jgi:hypothetical protein